MFVYFSTSEIPKFLWGEAEMEGAGMLGPSSVGPRLAGFSGLEATREGCFLQDV